MTSEIVTQAHLDAIRALAPQPFDDKHPWYRQCHGAALAIVRARIFPMARVARGTCRGLGSQHSWVVVGDDCFDPHATIVDPTLWSWDPTVPQDIWVGDYGPPPVQEDEEDEEDEEEEDEGLDEEDEADRDARRHAFPREFTGRHVPHGGFGSIWAWGRPDYPRGPIVALVPKTPLSRAARDFLDMLGPLDRVGWSRLTHAPPGGWPAGEIFAAMEDTPALQTVVPIDAIGMLTMRNPGGLYLAKDLTPEQVP